MRLSSIKHAVLATSASVILVAIGGYFTFAALQGDFGVVKRVQITAEKQELTTERDRLKAEVARMQNLTERLSDDYLDVDLLDERARNVLGYVRADEIVIR